MIVDHAVTRDDLPGGSFALKGYDIHADGSRVEAWSSTAADTDTAEAAVTAWLGPKQAAIRAGE